MDSSPLNDLTPNSDKVNPKLFFDEHFKNASNLKEKRGLRSGLHHRGICKLSDHQVDQLEAYAQFRTHVTSKHSKCQVIMTPYRNVKVLPSECVICFRMGSILFSKMPQVLTDFEVQKIGFDCAPSSASHCNNCGRRASVQKSGHPTKFSETKQRR